MPVRERECGELPSPIFPVLPKGGTGILFYLRAINWNLSTLASSKIKRAHDVPKQVIESLLTP
jgi:hypothetical protein